MLNSFAFPLWKWFVPFTSSKTQSDILSNADSIGPPKWEPRSNICVYLWHSPFHTRIVALVYNSSTGYVSPQHHVVFDDDFTMVPMEAGIITPHWSDLVHSSSELVSKHALNLAQAWLGSTGQVNTDLQFTDNPVADPFTTVIVTDCHTSNITKNIRLYQAPNIIYHNPPQQRCCHKPKWLFPREVPWHLEVSIHSSPHILQCSPCFTGPNLTSQGRNITLAIISKPSMAQPVDELTGLVLQFHTWNHFISELLVSVETFPTKVPWKSLIASWICLLFSFFLASKLFSKAHCIDDLSIGSIFCSSHLDFFEASEMLVTCVLCIQ